MRRFLTRLMILSLCTGISAELGAVRNGTLRVNSDTSAFTGGGGGYEGSGGVVQEGSVSEFIREENGEKLTVQIRDLIFLGSATGSYPFAIKEGKTIYVIPLDRAKACPAAHFILDDGTILYTIDVNDRVDEAKKKKYGLVEKTSSEYVHRSFADSVEVTQFLFDLDINAEVTTAPPEVVQRLKEAYRSTPQFIEQRRSVGATFQRGTYMNYDLNVVYTAYLTRSDSTNSPVVDIAGLPFRFHYRIGSDRMVLDRVSIFTFPLSEQHLNYEFVNFFQNLAAFRTFQREAPEQFGIAVRTACGAG